MPVRDHKSPQRHGVIENGVEARMDEVDPVVLGRKGHAAIDQQPLSLTTRHLLERKAVHTDLAETAKRRENK